MTGTAPVQKLAFHHFRHIVDTVVSPSFCKLQPSSTLQPAVYCLLQGVSEQAMVQVIAPAVKPLVSDRASAVKEQCFAAVGSWLGASRSVASLGALFHTLG